MALAKPTDHACDGLRCVVMPAPFDFTGTIFEETEGALVRARIAQKFGFKCFWSDEAVATVAAEYATVPRAPLHDGALLEFMHTRCDFAVEHADGSFMDHLQFCYEYSAAHYRGRSPRVLLLHSIYGTTTNVFPMRVEREAELRRLLTPFEFAQARLHTPTT